MSSTLFERTAAHINEDTWVYPSRGSLTLIAWHTGNDGKRTVARVNIRTKWMRRLLFRLSMEVGKQKARRARRQRTKGGK